MGKALGIIGSVGGTILGNMVAPGIGGQIGGALGGALGGSIGGGGGGSSSLLGTNTATSSSSATSNVPAWLQPYLQSNVQSAVDLSKAPYTPYTGQRVSPLSTDEQSAFGNVRSLIGQTDPYYAQSQGAVGQIIDRGLHGFDQATLNQYMNPYIQNVMDISKQRQLDQFSLDKRDLQQQQGNIGAFGGSRSAIGLSQLQKNFGRQLSENETNQLYQGYNDAQNRAMAGTQMAGQSATTAANLASQQQKDNLSSYGALASQGATSRGIAQAGLDTQYQDFLTQQQWPYQQAQFAQGFINPAGGLLATRTSTGSETPGNPGLLGQGLGVATMLNGFMGNNQSSGGMNNASAYTPQNSTINWNGGGSTQYFNDGGSPINWYKGGGQVSVGSMVDGFHNSLAGFKQGGMVNYAHKPHVYGMMGHPGYACGGMVEHYDAGGLIGGVSPEEFWSNLQQPGADQLPGNMFSRAWDRYQSTGGLAGSADDMLSSKPAQWAINNPDDSIGAILSTAPILGPAMGLGAKGAMMAAPKIAQGTEGLINLASKSPKIADMLTRLGMSGLGLSMLNHGNKADAATTEASQAADKMVEAIHGKGSKLPVDTTKPIDMLTGMDDTSAMPSQGALMPPNLMRPAMTTSNQMLPTSVPNFSSSLSSMGQPTSGQQEQPKHEMNTPLIAFGAALLGSKGNFFNALGDAGTSYVKENDTKEARIQSAAQKALANQLSLYKAQLYGQQVKAQTDKANDPLTQSIERLKMQTMQRKLQLGDIPAQTAKYYNALKANAVGKVDDDKLHALARQYAMSDANRANSMPNYALEQQQESPLAAPPDDFVLDQ